MGGGENLSADGDADRREFDRIDGELDAAVVFAAAAHQAFHNGNADLGVTCLSDARDGYASALNALAKADLSGAQIQTLRAKLLRLKGLLEDLRPPGRNEAA
jgi:hypothetical protein